jgi:predicted  nucleic acid-binding Zn ribbon protein
VPFYRIPSDEHGATHGINDWASQYQSCDELWIGSDVLEMAAYRQLSRLDSKLTQLGLGACKRVTAATGEPVYYYLMRYYGRSLKSELARHCPGCGGEWLLDERWHRHFDFRCDRCRLVSTIAADL